MQKMVYLKTLNITDIKVLEKEIELLKIQMEELRVSTTNPLSN